MQLLRERGVLVERVLEAGREVDLGGLDGREAVEQLVGQRRRAVLDRAGQAVLAGDLAERAEHLEVELDLGDVPSGSGTPPCDVPVWTLTLREAGGAGLARLELALVAGEVGAQLVLGRVLLPTSPISPPTLTVTPSGSSERISAVISAARA